MALIVNTKSKKQEKTIKDFLASHDIDFETKVEEDAVTYRTTPKKSLTQKEKKY